MTQDARDPSTALGMTDNDVSARNFGQTNACNGTRSLVCKLRVGSAETRTFPYVERYGNR